MALRVIPFSTFVHSIIRELRGAKASLFVGAGVSMLPPSQLPSGPALKDFALFAICRTSQLSKYYRRFHRIAQYHRIVPEIAFQELYDVVGGQLLGFFAVLRDAEPNAGHSTLGAILRTKRIPVLTTNFDTLLEQAAGANHNILHLHGALDDPLQMITRINQVGKGLTLPIRNTVRSAVRRRSLIILGYSGADRDVQSALISSNASRLYWLLRNQDDRAWPHIQRLGRHCDITVAAGDLGTLFSRLSRHFPAAIVRSSTPNAARAHRGMTLRKWAAELTHGQRLALLARLLFVLDEYRECAAIALRGAKCRCREVSIGWFLSEASNAYRRIGRSSRAIELADQAILSYGQRGGDHVGRAAAHNVRGLAVLEKVDFEPVAAAEEFGRGIQMIEGQLVRDQLTSQEVPGLLARLYNNLGLARSFSGQTKRAIQAFRRSVALKRRAGDIVGLAQTYANISLTYYKAADYRLAYQWRYRARILIEEYDLRFARAYLLRRMGSIAIDQGREGAGRRMLDSAAALYEELPDAKAGRALTRRIMRELRTRN